MTVTGLRRYWNSVTFTPISVHRLNHKSDLCKTFKEYLIAYLQNRSMAVKHPHAHIGSFHS